MNKKLFVGGISYSTTEESLKQAFSEFGTVESAVIITDRDTGRSKGFGFVEFSAPEEAQAAMEKMDGQELDGRRLAVKEARPPREDNRQF